MREPDTYRKEEDWQNSRPGWSTLSPADSRRRPQAAAWDNCSQGFPSSYPFKQTRRYGSQMYVHCCKTGAECSEWNHCGYQCA